MKQPDLGLSLSTKRTRKREFLDEMNRVVPWSVLVELVAPYAVVKSVFEQAAQGLESRNPDLAARAERLRAASAPSR